MSDVLQMKKGMKLQMKKADGSAIKSLRLELSWRPNAFDGAEFDLDATAVILNDTGDSKYPFGQALGPENVLYYNSQLRTKDETTTFIDLNLPKAGKPTVPNCAMIHSGDNRNGQTAGDRPDEIINIFLDRMPAEANAIHILVTIDEAEARGQTFGMVNNAKVEIFDNDTNVCLAKYDLEGSTGGETALVFVDVRKKDNGFWSVGAVNQGFAQGLSKFFNLYGLATDAD
jgi:tellurium resistance protein TerD